MSEKIYGDRDLMAMDSAGNYYCRHVDHMTREKLHSKSDIAAELGWRDMQIANLQQKLTATNNILKSAGIEADTVQAGVMELVSRINQVVAEMSVVESIHDECVFITDDDYDGCPKSVQKIIRSLAVMKIPATEAYLNAVRAEGLDMAAAEIDRWVGCGSLAREIRQKSIHIRAGNAGKDGV